MKHPPVEVARATHLSPAEVTEVLVLTRAAGDADGAYPLSEHVMLHLRHGGDLPAVHLLIRDDQRHLIGYAHVDTTDQVEGASAELTVHPLYRRRGLGRALVLAAIAAVEERDPTGRLRLWAHGDHPSANALAMSLGFVRARVLWQMRRSLYAPVLAPRLPDDVVLRPFRPGLDDAAWLAVNRRAFASHPDQGRWAQHDLQVRLTEPWFEAEGFLLAEAGSERWHDLLGDRPDEEGGRLLGFHWTKVHGDVRHPSPAGAAAEPHHHDPIGEVYILGVDPAAHGLGLGTALTVAGLRHLRARGLDQVMLYVEETNSTAVGLYRRLGFARWSTDVCFRRPG